MAVASRHRNTRRPAMSGRGYVCMISGAPIDSEINPLGRWCSGHPGHLHLQHTDGSYENGRPAWEQGGPVVTPSANGHAKPAALTATLSSARLVRLSDVTPQPVNWLWPGRVPYKKITIVDGDPGLGKTTVLFDIAARRSTGSPMPDGTLSDRPGAGGVVIMSAEDGLDDTIRPRLDAAGADVRRIMALVGIQAEDGDGDRLPTLADVTAIHEAILSVDADMVIIDPFMAYLPSRVESKSNEKVRSVLRPLARLAEETGVAVLLIRHLNKQQSANALYRGGGTIGIIGAARSGLLVAQDPDDSSRRIVAMTKANLSALVPALAYRLIPTAEGAVSVAWEGESEYTADRLLAEPQTHEERSATADAVDWLRDLLESGPRAARDIEADARRSDISPKVLRTAREKLGVRPRREGFGPGSRVMWGLQGHDADAHRCPIDSLDAHTQDVGMYDEYGASMADVPDAEEGDGAPLRYPL